MFSEITRVPTSKPVAMWGKRAVVKIRDVIKWCENLRLSTHFMEEVWHGCD